MEKLKIKIEKLSEDAIIPTYAHDGDAGADLYAPKEYILSPMKRITIGLGFKMEIPAGYEAQIRPKSGLAKNTGLTVLNTPGTVDSGYRGEVGVILINLSQNIYKVEKGQKIAQFVFNKVENAEFLEDRVNETTRGSGGFGSTGK